MDQDEKKSVREAFREAVNMTPGELEDWLGTEESQAVGQKDGGGESFGHASGRKIVQIKRKQQADYTDDDYAHMKNVTGYVHRHMKQRPKGDVSATRWRYSLMNWGHDPLR